MPDDMNRVDACDTLNNYDQGLLHDIGSNQSRKWLISFCEAGQSKSIYLKALLGLLFSTPSQDFFTITSNMVRSLTLTGFVLFSFLLIPFLSLAEGSKNLTPSFTGTEATANNFVGYLMHDQEFGTSGNFLNAAASADERLYIHVKAGETVYMGFRRILPLTNFQIGAGTFGNATLTLRENDGTLVNTFAFTADAGTTQSAGFVSGTGVIESYAEALAGPSAVVGVSGYDAISYTNITGSDQDFYIELVEAAGEESWYDLWDISVYDGTTEKPGRMFCKRWAFNAGAFGNVFSDDFQLFIRIPSTVGGADAGNYIKEIDLAGIAPFATSVFANSTGANVGTSTDLNDDGVIDFQDARRSQTGDVGELEYDIFINNPDIELYATTILPTVRITDAVFHCNSGGTGGEASITIESNQSGIIAIFLDLDGTPGFNDGTEDIIIEQLVDASSGSGSATISWDGLNGLNAIVPSGTNINISGRFSAGPLHIPLFDPEANAVGINMLDIRPQTSFDLVYWDDRSTGLDSSPDVELTGTNTGQHIWTGTTGNNITVNTWSYGFLQSSTQNVTFIFDCDPDGDGLAGGRDLDSDNDGISNVDEGDPFSDADDDGIFDYLDSDFAGYVDSNNDGVNDNFDQDLDGVVDALDLDSDNDGVPDLVENDQPDTDLNGQLDSFTDLTADGINDSFQGAAITNTITAPDDCQEADAPTHTLTFSSISTLDATADVDLIFDIQGDYGGAANENFTVSVDGTGLGTTFDPGGNDCDLNTDFTVTIPQATWNAANDDGSITIVVQAGTGVNDNVGGCNDADGDGIEDGSCLFNIRASYSVTNPTPGTALTLVDTDTDGVNDYLDLDSDNDGIVDVIEFGGTADASSGQISGFTDANNNGFNDAQESVALTRPDTDADGSLIDARDIDADNDGIPDTEEAQTSVSFIASAAGDTNGNGLLDVYDPTNGGTFLPTVDTDSDGTADYVSTDSDGDGVADIIEGHDANFNGFGDWDSNSNNILETADFSGFDSDGDSDGLWNVFDTDNGGTAAPTQNTDGADNDDWQDTDDDNDGILTSGEDTNTNNDFTDDKTQGQGGSAVTPDYLFRGDYDGDSIVDALDADSDNDGILDSDEDNGIAIDPSQDSDSDGIPNYRDDDIDGDGTANGADSDTGGVNTTSFTDANGDGTIDQYDSDLDGVPDFLDLDSDNDGLWDAVEANEGAVPFGLDTTTGQFTLQDPDNDGIMNFVDTDDVSAGGSSDLANPDTDSDGFSDYRDIDSDGDGIPDIVETQTTAAFIGLANADADGDGIDDNFDPDAGGTLITPVNSEAQDLQDYLDTDSDNDGVLDVIEGDDVNQDGFGDWDANMNNILDDGSFNVDTDGDGLSDVFDTVTKGTIGNETGSNADLQNTDGIDFRNWRDSNDDNDAVATADEDANLNGNFADDLDADPTNSVPDFLFFNDFDNDGITDASDGDSDNDGILDVNEAGGESVDPSADADSDGIPNFRDPDIVGLSSTADTNSDGIFDVFDQDLDGIPDFRDRDSDNDGVPDLVEAGGVDTDGNGIVDGIEDADNDGIPNSVDVDSTGGVDSDGDSIDDNFDFSIVGGIDTDGDEIIDGSDPDSDGDGIADTYDADNGGATLIPADNDADGLTDYLDLDSDNDGIPDLIEYGGTDTDGDGQLDDLTDTNTDGMADLIDVDNGGTALTRPDSDNDGIRDYLDLDSDNDGLTDTVESGGDDTNNDGAIDGFASDTDNDGLADSVDPDNSGTPIGNSDIDGDGVLDFRDLDVDNDGYPDILEAGGTDSDNDGIVNNQLDSDNDGVPDNVDVSQFATNGGSGTDSDGDQIDDTFDVTQTGGSDTDGDGIDNTFDTDANGDGYDDAIEASPYGQEDKEGDGNKDFRDMDSDGDGIPDVTEFGQTVNLTNAQISGFTDANTNGWNDTQEVTPITPGNGDSDGLNDYQDIDADDDGIPDNLEAQTNATYIAISDADTDGDGLDDAYDPDNGGTILVPVNTDGTGNDDYLDTDSDDDTVPDAVEGANDDRSQFADWDSNSNNDATDEATFSVDNDNDGLRDLYDTDFSATSSNVTGSIGNAQDSDADGIWDHQDTDDDGDNLLTSAEDTDTVDGDPTNDFAGAGTPIPDYLFGNQDIDVDGVIDGRDLDSDNDGIANTDEDGGVGIDPSGDIDFDGLRNFEDPDIDGDGADNVADGDGDGNGTNTTSFTDTNADGVIDQFDKDLDGSPDYLDLDSDNDGITDLVEHGLPDVDTNGQFDGFSDATEDGIHDGLQGATITYDLTAADDCQEADAPTHTINFSVTTLDATGDVDLIFDIQGDYGGAANEDFTATIDGIGLGTFDPGGNDCDLVTDFTVTIPQADWNTSNDDGSITIVLQAGAGVNDNVGGCNDADGDGIEDGSCIFNVRASYTVTNPSPGTPTATVDSDSDGVENYLDIDSDNDGIVDNVEAQLTASYIAPALGDTDSDGLLDVYDANNGGTSLDPVNTDSVDELDYLDDDSDNDGVADNIEAFDANSDGLASWDTDGDNDITDEGATGFNIDSDNDGLWLIFDNSNGLGTLANITGSSNNRQDTDGDATEDWRDTNDDNDLLLTSAEDANVNTNFSDDFTQGGGSTPDYLFNPDVDGDNITDSADGDSDNDGILNTDEYAGTTYAVGSDVSGNAGTPFGDSDGDGIFNYLDDSDVNFTITDVNGDGVDDRVDQDRDGIPNFFDIDSDDDGILDAIEANSGVTPVIGSFSTSTGRFSGTDGDSDGIVDAVEAAPLANPNFDPPGVIPADALDDYLDIDSDEDGITDNVEGQTTGARVNPSDTDTDGDGWDDSYDPDNGGTAVVPTNTDGAFAISDTEPDYRDIDTDNDNDGIGFVGDQIEGFDANRNGFSELDSNLDLDLSDEVGYNTDTDGDGLWDLYDNFSGRGVNNINGTSANLQDTDGDGILDFRDQDDDEDNISTAVEDVDSDGDWTNDKFQGGGATPDYLFFNDSDNDRIADGQDADGDNDGISDSDEYDASVLRNPFGDQDGDGVFNYNDPDNPNRLDGTTALTDSNADGIWDEYDTDLDGVPNFFDLDSDNDGIPDIVEAGGTDSNNDGILDGIEDSDDDGIPDNVDVDNAPGNGGSGVDTDGDDIDDTFDADQTAGTDADGDSILDTFDFDDDGDGIINIIDTDEGGAALADGDFDGDGLQNRIDLDSDSDGITDLIEARGSDTDGNGQLDTTGDTDGDGWGNLTDPDNGGTPHSLPDTDTDGSEDYLDIDADTDGVFDYNEGFDDDEDDTFTDDYTDRATAFGNASFYDPLDLFWYNLDSDADNTPDFLDPDSPRFVDTDGDGIIDLFDTDNGGNFYGNVSGKPDNDSDATENYIDLDGEFTISTTSITTGEDGTNDNFTVVLTQQPTTNVVINISETSDEVSLSTSTLTFTNGNWNVAQPVTVNGEDDGLNDGDVGYSVLVSVSDALSDDNFDNATNKTVNGTNLDNEGSIRVSTNTASTAENGSTVDFTVELTVAPTTNVVIDISEASDEGALSGATLSGGQLTFTNGNWNVPQTVTITPADDNLLDGDQLYNITASVNDPLSDDGFDAAADEFISVTNADDDVGFILSKTTATTSEDGTTDQFTVVLDVQPGAGQVVVIDLTESSDEGSVGPTQLTFDEFTWNVAQPVTITPANDSDLDGNQVYNITLAINTGSTTDNSFDGLANQTVSVTNQDDDTTPLPLDLLSFEGEFDDGSVWLNWVTANERNVDYMAVERSFDGITYEQIGRISANNTETEIHEYAFEDERPAEGFNYYRLNTVDYDGSYELSSVVIVMATAREFEIKAYPNPVVDRLTISSTLSLGSMSYSVYDVRGKLVNYGRFNENEFESTIDLSQLPTGIYHLIVNSPTVTENIRIKKLSNNP